MRALGSHLVWRWQARSIQRRRHHNHHHHHGVRTEGAVRHHVRCTMLPPYFHGLTAATVESHAHRYLVLRLQDNQLRAVLDAMKSIFRDVLVLAVMGGVAAPVLACLPMPSEFYAKTEKRVHERFDSVDSVVLVTRIDSEDERQG